MTAIGQSSSQRVTLLASYIKSIPNEEDLRKYREQHGNKYYQTAYHGSPYNFNKFDLGQIGNGEGEQAHGWGLYFAKDKEVSKAYKEVLQDKGEIIEFDGKKYQLDADANFVNIETNE